MNNIIVQHNELLTNQSVYDLLIQGVRDQFLNPTSRIILSLSDKNDKPYFEDQIMLLQKVYHDVRFDKQKRRDIGREKDITYHNDNPFDQAMYIDMLGKIIDPSTQRNMFLLVEQDVLTQLSMIETKVLHRHVRRSKYISKTSISKNEINERKTIEDFRHKKVKYSKISEHPKAKAVSKLYHIPIKDLQFSHLKYYFTRHGFQYIPFDRNKPLNVSIKPYHYGGAIRDLASYNQSGSYYDRVLNEYQDKLDDTDDLRIDQLDIPQDFRDFLALSYVKYRPNTFIITVWNPAYEHLQTLVDKLNQDGNIYYVREFDLDRSTLEGVMFWMYDEFSFQKRTDFIGKKLEYIGANESSNKIALIVFDNVNNLPIAGQASKYKKELRYMMLDEIEKSSKGNVEYRGNDLIHVNDFHYQTVEYAQMFFSPNTLKYIGIQDRSLYLRDTNEKSNLIYQTFRSYMYRNADYRDIDRTIIFGSTILYALGIRRNSDLDAALIDVRDQSKEEAEFTKDLDRYFMNPKTKFEFADIGIPSSRYWKDTWTERNKVWFDTVISGPESLLDFTTNPKYHIYFQGIKVCLLQFDIVKKILRAHGHDIVDLAYIDQRLARTNLERVLREYYSIKESNDIAKLESNGYPIDVINKDIYGIHGKDWAIPGKTDDLERMRRQIKHALKKRYDSDQIKIIVSHPVFKFLVPNYS